MNATLSEAAVRAVTAKGFERRPHWCQKWVRQVVQRVYGDDFDPFMKPTALESARAFLQDGRYVVPLHRGSVPGDLLYKMHGSGGDGHVAIRVIGNRVAENSSLHWNAEAARPDARGFRSLKEYGHYDLIVRLPVAGG